MKIEAATGEAGAVTPLVPRVERTMLPVIDRPLDNTAMTAYSTCPREYMFGMVEHRRGEGRAPALVYGAAWHVAMAVHYRTGGDRDRVIRAVFSKWEGHDSPDDYRTMERVILDYDKYVEFYGPPGGAKDAGRTIGDPPLVEVPTNALANGLLHPWAGKLDRFIDLGGLVYIEDHKTTSRLDKHYFSQYELSRQMKGYQFLAQQVMPGRIVVGVRINLAHVLTKSTAFHRREFTFSPDVIAEWVRNENAWMKRLARDYELLAAGDEDAFPGHYGDNGCSRKFGMCGYHKVCQATPKARRAILERDYPINPWNPLEADDDGLD